LRKGALSFVMSSHMEWVSAPNIEDAPLEPARRRFSPVFLSRAADRIEAFLEPSAASFPYGS